MTQSNLDTPINPATKSGSTLADDLSGTNKWRDALHSLHKGSSRPSYAQAGMLWVDDTNNPLWDIKLYDGTNDIVLGVFNTTANTVNLVTTDGTQTLTNKTITTSDNTITIATTAIDGIVRRSTTAQNIAGALDTVYPTVLGLRQAFNAAGSAPVFVCRAWWNFDGTGAGPALAIRGSGNISGVTDIGIGTYDVGFTTSMQDVNYCVNTGIGVALGHIINIPITLAHVTRIYVLNTATALLIDDTHIFGSIIR